MCSYFENDFSINPNQPAFEKYFKVYTNLEKDEFLYKEFIESLIEFHIDDKDNEEKISYYEILNFLCDSLKKIEKNSKENFRKKIIEFYQADKLFNYNT